jgi:hypothetical protein
VEKRAAYTLKIATKYNSKQLVFVDESAADRRTTYRGYAWAIGGRRAVRKHSLSVDVGVTHVYLDFLSLF